MNILITVNVAYLKHFLTMLRSIESNTKGDFTIYVISKDVNEEHISVLKTGLNYPERFTFVCKKIDNVFQGKAPVSKKWPETIYYRLFAGSILPESVDKILYLDTDIIVLKDLNELYSMDFNGKIFIGATHTCKFLRWFNQVKNHAPKKSPYLNTGVLMIDLNGLRKVHSDERVFGYIKKNYHRLLLPDQDVLQGLYGDKLGLIDSHKYGLSDRHITLNNMFHKTKIDKKWVDENCCIIHYIGKNKPWKGKYKGFLNQYYYDYYTEKF